MFRLQMSGWAHNRELQIIQADVTLELHGTTLIDEPLCVDVGMPALARSATCNVWPDRFAPSDSWEQAPFFVCGCGDPECRAYLFGVEHADADTVRLIELEQSGPGESRELDRFELPVELYRSEVRKAAEQFIAFIEERGDYKPLYPDTYRKVAEELARLKKDGYNS